ncbi:MAG: hypothetical protein EBU46_14835 [Nitrosomonadaceae bacterium]|nr:hypothetical protein [Nitrosomonadaceae bacterium]
MATPPPILIPVSALSVVDELRAFLHTANQTVAPEVPGDLFYNVREGMTAPSATSNSSSATSTSTSATSGAYANSAPCAWCLEITDLFSVLCDMVAGRVFGHPQSPHQVVREFGAACWRAVRGRLPPSAGGSQFMLRLADVSPASFRVWAVVWAPETCAAPGPSWRPLELGTFPAPRFNPVAGLFWRAAPGTLGNPGTLGTLGTLGNTGNYLARSELAARSEWLLAAARRRAARRPVE